jgi:deoxyadenosine/deoxycytidine kinase
VINPGQIRYPLLWVEGLIASGKSTLCREVGKRLNLRVIEEPADENPLLKKFYQDPRQWAFPMQVWLLDRRKLMQQLAALEATGIGGYQGAILDRSISGDRVFAKMLWREGHMSEECWHVYESSYDGACRTLLPPTKLLFLDVQPETAHERMKMRGRTAEKTVSLDYLKKLRDGYQELLWEAETGLMPWAHAVKVTRMVWDPINDKPDWDRIAETIRDSFDTSKYAKAVSQ